MDFRFSSREEAFRQEVDDFIERELPANWAEESLYWPGGYGTIPDFEGLSSAAEEFRRKLADRGWLALTWPKEYGGGERSQIEQAIFQERMSYHRAPGPGVATLIAGPTMLQFGSEETKRKWLPRVARAEIRFWLAYSEPNAGSDLAAIKTSAVEDGDDLIINGQKTWSSGAHVSDYAWMLVRTNPDAPAHKGISLIIMDNRSKGMTIRPLINICGFHSYNEMFFDDVRVPKSNIVGDMNRGWYYAMSALDFERLVVPIGNFKRTFEELVLRVKKMRLNDNMLVKDRLAELAIDIDVAYMFFWQTAWMLDKGLLPNIEASVLKLITTQLSQKLASTAVDILGPYGELGHGTKWTPLNGRLCIGYLDCISALVGAGTSEIQRNIIAMRGLGLPWA